jgi:hypothetical protein
MSELFAPQFLTFCCWSSRNLEITQEYYRIFFCFIKLLFLEIQQEYRYYSLTHKHTQTFTNTHTNKKCSRKKILERSTQQYPFFLFIFFLDARRYLREYQTVLTHTNKHTHTERGISPFCIFFVGRGGTSENIRQYSLIQRHTQKESN